MSITLQTIENPKVSLSPNQNINLFGGGINNLELQVNINQPNQLKIVLNSKIGKSLYDFFITGSFNGLRLTNTTESKGKVFDMAFIKISESRKEAETETGEIEVIYESVSSLLGDTEYFPREDVLGIYKDFNSHSFFKSLVKSDYFVFDVITSDTQTFYSGFRSALEALNTGVEEYTAFTWREVGIINQGGVDKCLIEVGNPKDRKFKGFFAEKLNSHANLNDGQNIELSNVIIRETGILVRSLIPAIENSGGADPASVDVTYITENNIGQISSIGGFLLEQSGFRVQSPKGLVNVYKVTNTQAPQTGKGDFLNVQTPSSFNEGGQNVSENFAQVAYNRAVASLRGKEEQKVYEVAINTPYLLPAGEPIQCNYVSVKPDNTKIIINGIQYIGSGFTYNISNFINP